MKALYLNRRKFLAASAAFATTAATSWPTVSYSAANKVLRVRHHRDILVLDPGWMVGAGEIDLQYACLGTLAVYTPGEKLGWQPSPFVESLDLADPLRIKFKLRPGFKWTGDYGEVTAEDVSFSIHRIADPQNKADWRPKWAVLDHVEIVDKYTGVIVLKQPFAPLVYTTLCDGSGSILSKKAVEAKVKSGGHFTTEFPAMCGPYVVKNWIPKQRIEIVRNPLWTGPQPNIDEIHILIVQDDKAAELAYDAGEVDLTTIDLTTFGRIKSNLPPHTKLVKQPGLQWTWMGMNTEHPKLKDIRVRRAIQSTVDVDAILQAAYSGLSPRSFGIVPPGLLGHRTTTAFMKPDLAKAKALMAEAGVSSLDLTLKTLSQPDRIAAAEIIQSNLVDIGVKVDIVPLDPGPFWVLGSESAGNQWKDLELYIIRFGDSPDPSQMTQWYINSQVGVNNWERWKSPEFDDLHNKAMAETDETKRNAMYIRMQEIMEDTGAYVWITHEPVVAIYRDTIEPVILPGPHFYYPGFKWA